MAPSQLEIIEIRISAPHPFILNGISKGIPLNCANQNRQQFERSQYGVHPNTVLLKGQFFRIHESKRLATRQAQAERSAKEYQTLVVYSLCWSIA